MLEPSITGFFVSVLPILLYWMKGRHGKFTCKWLYHLPLFDEIDPKKKNTKNEIGKQNWMLVANLEKIECLGWSDKHKMTWDELQSV